jgi:hypothetical protein
VCVRVCGVGSVYREVVLPRRDANFRSPSPVENAEISIGPTVDPQTLVSKRSAIDILSLAKWSWVELVELVKERRGEDGIGEGRMERGR